MQIPTKYKQQYLRQPGTDAIPSQHGHVTMGEVHDIETGLQQSAPPTNVTEHADGHDQQHLPPQHMTQEELKTLQQLQQKYMT